MTATAAALPGFEGVVIDTSGKRRAHDYYATPAWAVDAMLPYLRDRVAPGAGHLLEPGCGHGAVALPLARAGYRVCAVDIREEAVRELRASVAREGLGLSVFRADFLEGEVVLPRLAAAVGNPPFSHALDFVKEAARQTDGVVCFLLPLSFLATTGRADFWREHPADVLVLDRRPDFTGGGGANAEYGWFQWPARGERGAIYRQGDFRGEVAA